MRRSARLVIILGVLVIVALIAIWVTPGQATGSQRYIVLYKQQSVPAGSADIVRKAGGTVVASYPVAGILIAQSSSGDFPSNMLADQRVEGVSTTRSLLQPLSADTNAIQLNRAAARQSDPLAQITPLSYVSGDFDGIKQSQTIAILGGSVDLSDAFVEPWIDHVESVSCADGAPSNAVASWSGKNGEGTAGAEYLAAQLAAAQPQDTEPKPKIMVVRITNDQGQVSPEALICGLNWAATHDVSAAVIGDSSSPLLLECRDVTNDRIAWFAEQRTLAYAALRHVQLLRVKGAVTEISPSPEASPGNQCAVLSSGINASPVVTTTP